MTGSRRKTAAGVLAVLFLVIALHWLGAFRWPEAGIRRVAGVGSRFFVQLGDAKEDACPITAATERDAVAEALLREENESLRRQLGYLARTEQRAVGAEVIGRNVEPIGRTLILNRGESDGIAPGQAVIAQEGILIGKIAKTEKDSAIVQLISDGQSKVAATLMNLDRSIGIVEGGYGISVRMTFIPQNESVAPGDLVITSGLEPKIPKGLIIGTVEAVEREPYEPFQRAVLSTRAKLDRVSLVSVLL